MPILIVDDDEDFVSEVLEGLRARGYQCRGVFTAEEAVNAADQDASIDVVITDIKVPAMGGLELMRKLLLLARPTPIRIVVVTGYASVNNTIAALRNQAVDFLQKPVGIEELAQAIDRAQGLRAAMRPAVSLQADKLLESLVAARSDRLRSFPEYRISDIGWHMILEIAHAKSRDEDISVTSACLGSGAPAATALRHLRAIETAGLVARVPDKRDKRTTRLILSPKGNQLVERFLERFERRYTGSAKHRESSSSQT